VLLLGAMWRKIVLLLGVMWRKIVLFHGAMWRQFVALRCAVATQAWFGLGGLPHQILVVRGPDPLAQKPPPTPPKAP